MIVTKEQQERIVEKYVKEKHNTDECIGFIDGINATIELINRIKIQQLPELTLEQAIEKAKPNMDKIKDVDAHLNEIK